MKDLATMQELSDAGRHQECLQACQNALQTNPEEAYAYKYAGKSLLALGQFEKAQQCLIKAHQLNSSDPEIVKDIGNIFLKLGNKDIALEWYGKALKINNNYAPAINNLANLNRQSGNHQEAIDLFKKAIQADPKLIQAYIGASASLLALGDLDQAESFAVQALAINVRAPGVNEILGSIFQNKSKLDQAVEYYQKELEVNPQASRSLLNLGILLLQKGETAAAVESLAKASNLAPSGQCSFLLAQAFQNLGQFKEAIDEYKKIDIKQAKNKMLPFNLGLCLLKIGNNSDAIEAFKIAIRLDDSFIPTWINLGVSLKKAGRLKEAINPTQKALELEPDNPNTHLNLGTIYKDLGQLDQALASILKSLELNPDNPKAHINLGTIYQDLGQLDQALSATQKSLELNPDNPEAHINMGGIYKELGQLDQALASTLKSIELKPNKFEALVNLGGIYQDLGKFNQALAATLKSLELKPNNFMALVNLGTIYRELGQLDQALAATQKSLELNPNNPKGHINMGGIYRELGEFDQALAATLKSLELKPDNPNAHMNLGGIYKELDNFEEANKAIQRGLTSKKPTLLRAILGFEYYDSTNQKEKLKQEIENVNKLLGRSNTASAVYNARLIFHEKAYKSSLEALQAIDPKNISNNFLKIRYYYFRGLAEEKLGLYEQAFNHFLHAQEDSGYRNITPKSTLERIKLYTSLAEKIKPVSVPSSHPIYSPVFIVGFPRSGTTLLDSVLRSHPSIEIVEEKDQLVFTECMAIREFGKGIEDFTELENEQLERLRHEYWKRLNSHVSGPGKTIIDKLPLNISKIPLIKILFPHAKIILAIRHPCDSVLSCFQQTFKPNPAMANFTSLSGSINFYSKVMTAWNKYCESFPVDRHVIRYEDLIEDFDGSIAKVINFIGIEWSESLKDYKNTALKRGIINTPSATQVSQPLYKTSIGKWKNYERHFEEHLPLLDPWIKQWGYK